MTDAAADDGKTDKALVESPQLRDLDEHDRSATPLELFFDLVFSAGITAASIRFAADPTTTRASEFLLLCLPVVWSWVQYSLYANRFDSDDAIYRLSKAAGMVGIALIGVAMAEALDDRSGLYVSGFLLARAMLLVLYERARRHVDDDAAAAARHYQLGYGAGGLAWLATLALHPSDRPVAWAAIVAAEMLVPIVAWRRLEGSAVNVSHLSERLGVFAILVLGTGWLSVVEGVSATGLLPAVLVVAVGLLLAALGEALAPVAIAGIVATALLVLIVVEAATGEPSTAPDAVE